MDALTRRALDYPLCEGAIRSGVATRETLAGGPPSAELQYAMPEARSAVVFAFPLDQRLIPDFLAKKDRRSFERNYETVNSIASGVAVKLANFLTQKGHPAVPLAANDVYRQDVPMGRLAMLPPVSLRYLAVAAGVGAFGLSGNVLTSENGAGVILGAALTAAELAPTPPLAPDQSYCDGCRLCMATCASGLMDPREATSVTMGGKTHSYAARRGYVRCQYVCGGYTGLHPSGEWSTWSPGRFPLPEDEGQLERVFLGSMERYRQRPEGPGGHYHSLMETKLYNTCANCQLVCVPDRQERRRRRRLLREGGVVVQNPDGTVEAVSPEEARRRLDAMDEERRSLYEGDPQPSDPLWELYRQLKEGSN